MLRAHGVDACAGAISRDPRARGDGRFVRFAERTLSPRHPRPTVPSTLPTERPTERFAWRSATLAVGLHVAVIAALFFSGLPLSPILVAPVDQEIRILENETVADTPPQSAPTEGTSTNLPGTTQRVDGPARVATADPRSVSTETATIEAPPTSSGAFTFYAPPTSSAIGITGTNRFLAPGALPEPALGDNGTSHEMGARPVEAKSVADSQVAINKALGESVADRSKKGLGPEGPVLRALEGATTGSLAPVRGTATFLAVVDGNGFVTNVKIIDSSGDAAGWEDARKIAVAALKGKKLPGKFAKTESGAAELRITVSSDAVLPSGTRPDGSPVGVAGGAMTFDLADLSGSVRRVVHARLTGIREM